MTPESRADGDEEHRVEHLAVSGHVEKTGKVVAGIVGTVICECEAKVRVYSQQPVNCQNCGREWTLEVDHAEW